MKPMKSKLISLLLAALMILASTQVTVWANKPPNMPLQPPTHEVQLSGHDEYAYGILTSTLNGSVGMQGFEGNYAISCPNDIVEIIVQFVTPPSVALRLMDERAISPQRVGRALVGDSFEEQALSAHNLFSQQLGSIPVPFGSGRSTTEILSEHHRLFNGVFMRVPGYMVSMIAALPEVFAVTPNVAFYTMAELEQWKFASYLQDEMVLYDDCMSISTVDTQVHYSPFFVNPDFMLTVREHLELDYIHDPVMGMGITGAGVRVAVLDTGIYHAHPEFARFLNPETGRIRGHGGVHFTNSPSCNTYRFSRNHGTTVSGTVIGVAPGIELWHYRVDLGDDEGAMHIIAGIEASYLDDIHVVNMSFGTPGTPFNPKSYVVNIATLSGMVMISTAGNWAGLGNQMFTIGSPGNASIAIAVGAGYFGGVNYSRGDRRVPYSSIGPSSHVYHIKPDVLAPTYVITTDLYSQYTTSHPVGGTSHAAPIITGIAALLLEAFPNATPYEIKARIMNTARPLAFGSNSVFAVGAGFVQPLQALTNEAIVTAEHLVPLTSNPSAPFEPAIMSSLSFGGICINDNEGMNKTIPIVIRNTSSNTQTYTISYMFTNNPNNAATISLSSTSVTITPSNARQIYSTMIIDTGTPLGFYEGYIYISDGTKVVARLPFGAVATDMTHDPNLTRTFRVYNEYELRAIMRQGPFNDMVVVVEIAADFDITIPFTTPALSDFTIRSADGQMHTLTARFPYPDPCSNSDCKSLCLRCRRPLIYAHSNLTLENIKITCTGKSHGIRAMQNLTIDGAIISGVRYWGVTADHGLLTMYSGEISGNDAGVLVYSMFNMYGGEISGNDIGVSARGIFNMYGGVIFGNKCGVYVSNTFNMHGGVITGNTTVGSGAGVNISDVPLGRRIFNMYGGTISGNTATTGGGVNIGNGTFNMHAGQISGNSATHGGGIAISIDNLRNGRLRIGSGAVFSNNTALNSRSRLPEDDIAYYAFIHTTQWTQPFTQGSNNFDIQNVHGTPIPMRRLIFHTNSTPASPTYPLHIAPLFTVPGTLIIQTLHFPTNPTRLGYTFAGWYLDSNLTQRLTPETIMPGTDTNLHARWLPIYVIFHFDNQEVHLRAANGYINTSQIPTPATRYGRVGNPGWAHMGWFAEIFDTMHWFGLGANRAIAFDLGQRITSDMTDMYGHLHLYASFLRYGDLNGDGMIDPIDRVLMQHLILGAEVNVHLETADVNVDSYICLIDRSLLQNFILGAPGIILGVPDPNVVTGSYLVSYHFGSKIIDLPIANGRINTTLITKEELLIWEMELLSFLYSASRRGGRATGLFMYVSEIDSGNSYMLELDTSVFDLDMSALALQISALELEISAMAALR